MRMNSSSPALSLTVARRSVGFLPLPLPDKPFASRSTGVNADLTSCPLPPPVDEVERAHQRWLLGHHVTFCVWRRLAGVLTRMREEGVQEVALDEAAAWFDRYSAMFVYAGSCGESLYRTAIRPSMAAVHPAFSGVWARDFTWVRRLLHELDIPPGSSLMLAIKRNRLVHMKIARTLVPEGESLLKDTGRRAADGVLPREEDLFDRYFLVDRVSVPEVGFEAHAARRAAAVVHDLERYPVHLPEFAELLDLLPADLPSLARDAASAFANTGRGRVA
ncbi:L-tyrosine 3-hydroxylase [Lentzea sp. NPDC004782]|uniref:L-tyrosine 3-hydroxylase n=1 Tax=Lentzea sp. NPDC004782 TaxID=3154458 RepID=UPI0033B6AFCC